MANNMNTDAKKKTTVTPSALQRRLDPFPFPYLDEYGRHVAMSDLAGYQAPPVERYKKIRFRCEHCKLWAEDFCLGLPTAMHLNPKTQTYESVMRGQVAVGCLIRWINDLSWTFAKEHGGNIALLLKRFYNASNDSIRKIGQLAPGVHELSCYNPQGKVKIEGDGVAWHQSRSIPLEAPDPKRITFVDMPLKMLMEATTLENWIPRTKEEFVKWFPNMQISSKATDATKSLKHTTTSKLMHNWLQAQGMHLASETSTSDDSKQSKPFLPPLPRVVANNNNKNKTG